MILIKCDICKKEIHDDKFLKEKVIKFNEQNYKKYRPIIGDIITNNYNTIEEICESCHDQIEDNIENIILEFIKSRATQ
jgi:hypothetical protein